jgi:hypothetical protein
MHGTESDGKGDVERHMGTLAGIVAVVALVVMVVAAIAYWRSRE